jgi:hypothetical protein
MINKKVILVGIKILFRVLVPIVLLVLPANYFDKGNSLCLSVVLFHTECPACGLTRACMHLIHFEFWEAFQYNMMCFISFPGLAAVWAFMFYKEVKLFKSLTTKSPVTV